MPIAYTYEADTHCPACAISRFGHEKAPGPAGDVNMPWPPEDAVDSEGNQVGAIFPWEEWCEPSELGMHYLACGTCRGIIEQHGHGDA